MQADAQPSDAIRVEALQQEADSIQEWLAGQHPQNRRPLVPPPIARHGADEVGAQRDVLQVLQDHVVQHHQLPGLQEPSPLHGAHSSEALAALQEHLCQLRSMYVTMGRRCEAFEQQLGAEEADLARQEAQHSLEHSCATAERREHWEALLFKQSALLEQGEEELQFLARQVQEAQQRRDNVSREEARLEATAKQDEATLERLRFALRRLLARNAGLEVEAQLLVASSPDR